MSNISVNERVLEKAAQRRGSLRKREPGRVADPAHRDATLTVQHAHDAGCHLDDRQKALVGEVLHDARLADLRGVPGRARGLDAGRGGVEDAALQSSLLQCGK